MLFDLNIKKIDTLFFKRSPGSVSTVLDGETVILDVETGIYSGLNEVGTVLWDVMENTVMFADMCGAVSEGFDVTAKECAEDVLSFLKELADNKLIEVSGGANT